MTSPTKVSLLKIAHNERNTTQHLAKLNQSHSWLVDRNRDDGGTPATAGFVEQDHEATPFHDMPQAPNGLGALASATGARARDAGQGRAEPAPPYDGDGGRAHPHPTGRSTGLDRGSLGATAHRFHKAAPIPESRVPPLRQRNGQP